MPGDPLERWTGAPIAQEKSRWRSLERFLLVVVVAAIVGVRYGLDATLTFIVLPLCLLGVIKAIAEVIRTRERQGDSAAAQVLADRAARILLLGTVGVFVVGLVSPGDIVGLISPGDEPSPVDPGPCLGPDEVLFNPDCQPQTTTTPTARSPEYVPTTVTNPGSPRASECPAPGNQERRLSFTAPPPFCLNRDMDYLATVETNYGSFAIRLNMDGAPYTVNNFAFLAGWHFYDGVPLAPSRPTASATSLFVGDPVDPSDADAAPGYSLTFESTNPPYPDGAYVVMVDGVHPNRFEIAISRSRREEIERSPNGYPLLGEVLNGDGIIIQGNLSGEGPRLPSETIVIKSVTITELPPS